MKDLQHDDGTFSVTSDVAAALEHLAVALSATQMSARVVLKQRTGETVELMLGIETVSGRRHALKARESTGEGSHIGWEDA